jgi:DNA repair photolyase
MAVAGVCATGTDDATQSSRRSSAGVAGVMAAPVIPAINEHEIDALLAAAHAAGAREAGYVMLRLPLEVQDIFGEWLLENAPARYRRVMSLMRSMREGKIYESNWGTRMTGTGPYAGITGRRFEAAARRLDFNLNRSRLQKY